MLESCKEYELRPIWPRPTCPASEVGRAPDALDTPGMDKIPQEAVIYAGLTAATDRILGRKYVQEETWTELHIERCPIDANYGSLTDLVYDFCRRSKHATVLLPSHGKYIGPKATPIANWRRLDGEQIGPG